MDVIEQLIRRVSRPDLDTARDRPASRVPKPATIQEVEQTEGIIGFPLPEIVRRIYLEVSDGGFGYFNHPILDIKSVGSEYLMSLEGTEHGQPSWPKRLVPICDWGCGIQSCLDCTSPDVPVIRVDCNLDVPKMRRTFVLGSEFRFLEPYSSGPAVAWEEAQTLEGWLNTWLSGADLFNAGYPPIKLKSER